MAIRWYVARGRNAAMDVLLSLVTGRIRPRPSLTRVGGGYGGFWVPSDLLEQKGGLLVSAGIGFDVQFDLEFLKRGYVVLALDPLPECVDYAQTQLLSPNFRVLNSGLWSRDGRLKFYAPRERQHDSWSAVNVQETAEEEAEEFSVVSLTTVARTFPEAAALHPSILKLNIEGAEAEVLSGLPASPIKFDIVVVHLESVSQVRLRSPQRFVRASLDALSLFLRLKADGYRVARTANLQMCLVRQAEPRRGFPRKWPQRRPGASNDGRSAA